MKQVGFGRFIDGRCQFGGGHNGGLLVSGGDRSKGFFTDRLDALFLSTIALGADDGLAGAFDRRFVICHDAKALRYKWPSRDEWATGRRRLAEWSILSSSGFSPWELFLNFLRNWPLITLFPTNERMTIMQQGLRKLWNRMVIAAVRNEPNAVGAGR